MVPNEEADDAQRADDGILAVPASFSETRPIERLPLELRPGEGFWKRIICITNKDAFFGEVVRAGVWIQRQGAASTAMSRPGPGSYTDSDKAKAFLQAQKGVVDNTLDRSPDF